jgi:ribonuclease HI
MTRRGKRGEGSDNRNAWHIKPGRYLLNTDGGVRNSGHNAPGTVLGEAAIGVVLCDPSDHEVKTDARLTGLASIQGAEYRALIRGLELARSLGMGKIRAFLDNQIVVGQINEEAAVKSAELKPLYARTGRLLDGFSDCRVYWVPRARNKRADGLVHSVLYPNLK